MEDWYNLFQRVKKEEITEDIIVKEFEAMLARGLDSNLKIKGLERTPLIEAADVGLIEIVKILLQQKIDVNAVDFLQCSALNKAADQGHDDIVKLLLNNGAQVDSRDCHQQTPLMKASYEGHIKVVKILLDHDADVNAQSRHQSTAIMMAADGGRIEIVKELLKHNPDLTLKDENQRTALDRAHSQLNFEVMNLKFMMAAPFFDVLEGAQASKIEGCESIRDMKEMIDLLEKASSDSIKEASSSTQRLESMPGRDRFGTITMVKTLDGKWEIPK